MLTGTISTITIMTSMIVLIQLMKAITSIVVHGITAAILHLIPTLHLILILYLAVISLRSGNCANGIRNIFALHFLIHSLLKLLQPGSANFLRITLYCITEPQRLNLYGKIFSFTFFYSGCNNIKSATTCF